MPTTRKPRMQQTGCGQCMGKSCDVDAHMADALQRILDSAIKQLHKAISVTEGEYMSAQQDRLNMLPNDPMEMRLKIEELTDIQSQIIIDFEGVYSAWATIQMVYTRLRNIDPLYKAQLSDLQPLIDQARSHQQVLLNKAEEVRLQLKHSGGRLSKKRVAKNKNKVAPVK